MFEKSFEIDWYDRGIKRLLPPSTWKSWKLVELRVNSQLFWGGFRFSLMVSCCKYKDFSCMIVLN